MNVEMQPGYAMVSPLEGFTNRAVVTAICSSPRDIKVGDTVLYRSGANHTDPVLEDGVTHSIIHMSEILAVLRPTN